MTKEAKSRKRRFKLPKPRTITLPGKDFQPSKADMEREYDMPEASPLKTIRNAPLQRRLQLSGTGDIGI